MLLVDLLGIEGKFKRNKYWLPRQQVYNTTRITWAQDDY
jgi:hypothetical protein